MALFEKLIFCNSRLAFMSVWCCDLGHLKGKEGARLAYEQLSAWEATKEMAYFVIASSLRVANSTTDFAGSESGC